MRERARLGIPLRGGDLGAAFGRLGAPGPWSSSAPEVVPSSSPRGGASDRPAPSSSIDRAALDAQRQSRATLPGASANSLAIEAGARSKMATTLRVARMSLVGSPPTSRRSARFPGAIRPRSASAKRSAGTEVAAASASTGVSPAPTRRSSSPCSVTPNQVPGFGASLPASSATPCSRNSSTVCSANA